MSWSVNYSGPVAKVVAGLNQELENLAGNPQAKKEYESALPHLIGAAEQNFNKVAGVQEAYIHLTASGHGSADAEGNIVSQTMQVTLNRYYPAAENVEG